MKLAGNLGVRRVNFAPDVQDDVLYDVGFYGVPAWDAFCHVLDVMGWAFRIYDNGPQVIQFDASPEPVKGDLIDGAFVLERPTVPASIKVVCQLRDYQWHLRTNGALTGGDNHRLLPTYDRTFATHQWNTTGGRKPSEPIEGHREGELVVWCPVFAIRGDDGTINNEPALIETMERTARRQFEKSLVANRAQAITVAGLQPHSVSSRWGSVTHWDDGEGLRTTFASAPLTMDCKAYSEYKPGAPQTRDWAPYQRTMTATIREPLDEDNITEQGDIVPGAMVWLQPRSGRVNGANVGYSEHPQVIGVNGLGAFAKYGKIAFCVWNYQLGRGGLWEVVAIAGTGEKKDDHDPDLADWVETCDVSGFFVDAIDDPTQIRLNKKSMLRLVDAGAGRAGISFQKGRANSILNTHDDGDIYWSTRPQAHAYWAKYGQIHFGFGSRPTSSLHDGGTHLVLPGHPGRSHKYAIAGATSLGGVKMDWIGPGVNVTDQLMKCMSAAEWDRVFEELMCRNFWPYFCERIDNCEMYGDPFYGSESSPCDNVSESNPATGEMCVEVQFENGLLVRHPDGNLPTPRYFVLPPLVPDSPFNPCVEKGSVESPGSPGDLPPTEWPDSPTGCDPTNPIDDPWDDRCELDFGQVDTVPPTPVDDVSEITADSDPTFDESDNPNENVIKTQLHRLQLSDIPESDRPTVHFVDDPWAPPQKPLRWRLDGTKPLGNPYG